MSNQNNTADIQKSENSIDIWNNNKADKIRQLFAPNLTNDEFGFFWGLGKSLQANPFTREIWAVKYDNKKPAQVFLGRDFYRKKAQEQPDYDGHIVDAVYENDEFRVESGTPEHSYSLTNRGKLLGAYSVVYRKDQKHPFFVFVELVEYHKGQSTWKEKPATMIKKVAEAQGLRGAYQGIFRGTYDESEQWQDAEVVVEQPTDRQEIDFEPDNNQQAQAEPEAKPEPKDTAAPDPREEILSEINQIGKQVHGKDWFRESKAYVHNYDEKAENLLDLDEDGLKHIKLQLEAKLPQASEA